MINLNTKKQILLFIVIPLVLAFIINLIIPDYKSFYSSLKLPFKLPSIVFPIVWTILYIIMGIASILVYREVGYGKEIKCYCLQLFFNITWAIIFFGFKNIRLTLFWTYILLILVVINAILYYKKNKLSGYLYIPYIAWVIFATYLITYINMYN